LLILLLLTALLLTVLLLRLAGSCHCIRHAGHATDSGSSVSKGMNVLQGMLVWQMNTPQISMMHDAQAAAYQMAHSLPLHSGALGTHCVTVHY
jgi:hypothetical protein